jgi:hypothetical protein
MTAQYIGRVCDRPGAMFNTLLSIVWSVHSEPLNTVVSVLLEHRNSCRINKARHARHKRAIGKTQQPHYS